MDGNFLYMALDCYTSRPQFILIRVPKLCRIVYMQLKTSLFEFNLVQRRSVVAKFWLQAIWEK